MVPPITTVDFELGRNQLGRVFRTPQPGPEIELVRQFLSRCSLDTRDDCRVTIFLEPKLERCYPDVVLVAWKPSVAQKWRPERRNLESQDLRLLQYLANCGSRRAESDLVELYGRAVRKRLGRLEIAGLVSKGKTSWRTKALSSIFATVAIVAIEAKMSGWRVAMQQAFQNTWFASDSYILVPRTRTEATLRSSASTHGIGVLNTDSHLSLKRAHMRPRSYASWLLNDLAWRVSLKTR
jgi:hypothetical protein